MAPRPGLVLAILAFGGCGFSMLQSLVVPALPTLQHELDTTPAGVAWIFTTYFLAASVATPVAGRFGDMFGKKRTLLVVLAGLARRDAPRRPLHAARDPHRRPRDPGGRRCDLPARLRDHPRRVPARARAGLDRADLGPARDRGCARDRPRRPDPLLPRLPLALLDPLCVVAATLVATWFLVPESPFARPDGSTGPGRRCSLPGSSASWFRSARRPLGLDLREDARPGRPRGGARRRLGRGRAADAEPARRHADDARALGLDDEPRRLRRRLGDVRRLHPARRVRADAGVDRATDSARR